MTVSRVLRKKMRFNKFLKLKTSSGQVAIILILVVAISLIFYAAALNLGKISQVKTLTTIASNQSASQMASQMASYGQQVFEVQLGGATRVCGWTGLLVAVLTVIAVVIAIAFPPSAGYSASVLTGLYIALAVGAGNLILQLTVVQPGITEMWNDIKNRTLSKNEIFIENGVQTGLAGTITDNKRVPDFEDLDRDGLFGLDSNSKPLDTISRYAVYYTKRLKEATRSQQEAAILAFQNALNEFLFAGGDGWGLFDPPNPNASCASSECNPCCVPEYKTDMDGALVYDSTGALIPLRPTGCPTDLAGARGICINGSDYPDPNGYPWVYDPSLENRGNDFLSFRELMGRDDRHKDYHKNPADPNGKQLVAPFPALPVDPTLLQRFVVKDTEGYYSPPDTRQSIDPFFYKVSDWKVDLTGLPETPFTTLPNLYDPKRYECHWCTVNRVVGVADECPVDQPAEILQLVLPNPSGLSYNTTQCVDGTDRNVLGNPPLAVDRVTLPTGILAADNECAQDAFDNLSLGLGFWKRGADDFCSTAYPYGSNCDKHKSASGWCTGASGSLENCECSTSGKSESWPDGFLDDSYYGIYDFFNDTYDIRTQNINELAGNFVVWYPTAAEWIEPPNTPLPHPSVGYSGGNICYVCDSEQGYLWRGRDNIGTMMSRLADFGGFGSNNYSGSLCDATVDGDPGAVWCVPPVVPSNPENSYGLDECRSVTVSEAATFDTNSNGIRGDLEDVVACLTWNIDDTVTYADATIVRGDYEKFNKCATDCSIEHCSDLPRSLVPGVNTAIPALAGLGTLQACLGSCNDPVCSSMDPTLFAGNPTLVPDDPTLVDWSITGECNPTNWLPGVSAWYDAISLILNTDLCDATPGGWFDLIVQSVPEAQVQAAKFRKRRDFLQGRLKELYGMIVPDNFDFTQLESCSSLCSNANCKAMDPVYFVSSGPFQTCLNFCSNAACNAMPNRSEFITAGLPDPATVNFDATECGATWIPGNLWYDTIGTVLANDGEADPSLVDFNTTQCGTWGPGNSYYDRIQKTGIFTRAYEKFNNFLTCDDADGNLIPDGPACRLIKARIENNDVDSGLPYQAIYGWQTDAPPGRTEGYWHIVRVDARAPGNCDGACLDGTIASGDPNWPNVRTYTKNWGLERCYEMADTEGMVKARVTRYDEDRDATRITFPNGVPIWDFRTQHPDRDTKDSFLTTLGEDCVGSMIPDPPVPLSVPCDPSTAQNTCTYTYFNGAFLLNEFINSGDSQGRRDNISCWRHVNSLLTKGITSETCARYYFHGGGNSGMGIEFVPCPAVGF